MNKKTRQSSTDKTMHFSKLTKCGYRGGGWLQFDFLSSKTLLGHVVAHSIRQKLSGQKNPRVLSP